MLKQWRHRWVSLIWNRPWLIVLVCLILTGVALRGAASLSISTDIESLMPENAASVQAYERVKSQTGSQSSVQIVVTTETPKTTLEALGEFKSETDKFNWVQSSQYYEDIEILKAHKLLLLSEQELLELEREIDDAIPNVVAKTLSDAFNAPVSITLRQDNIVGVSYEEIRSERLENIDAALGGNETSLRYFVSDDRLTGVLVIWPKPEYQSLTKSKQIISDTQTAHDNVKNRLADTITFSGVGGRIASQVEQYDSIIGDVSKGLLSAIILISMLLVLSFRRGVALPIIFIPLVFSIIWTLGLTAVTVTNLNLITVFLTLILFGLGIDFGIHNFARFVEADSKVLASQDRLRVVVLETGAASAIAAFTTAAAFYTLVFTEFRAFREFGFIAGSGILLAYCAMYSLMPALLVIFDRWGLLTPRELKKPSWHLQSFNPLYRTGVFAVFIIGCLIFAGTFGPQLQFEQNTKNLEATESAQLTAAKSEARQVLGGNNSRAVMLLDTYDELVAASQFFNAKLTEPGEDPSIKSISSLLDFVPTQAEQEKRLTIINRLKDRADALRAADPEKHEATYPYLNIGYLSADQLPSVVRKSVLTDQDGYLLFVNNLKNLNDRAAAKSFYEDAGQIEIDGQIYHSASQEFIFVEMLDLMKADAVKAITLVSFTTALMVLIFLKDLLAMAAVLGPTFLGLATTLGVMGAWGPNLSIMNMVILPSLIGISVDNGIHIAHRFRHQPAPKDITTVLSTTGHAALITTLTTLIGFGGMITASMGGLRSMAVLAIIGFVLCLVMTWFVLPAALVMLDRFRSSRNGLIKGVEA